MTRFEQVTKLLRFAEIYGWQRAINKAVARTRASWLHNPFVVRRRQANVSLIGCGQFAFSTICFFLQKNRGNAFLSTYDIDSGQAASLSAYYGFREVATSPASLLANPALNYLYIASNHASHTPYAIDGLAKGLSVYVEKPLAVTYQQLVSLLVARQQSTGHLFAGYNRPYSAAIQTVRQYITSEAGPGAFSLNYLINGHVIDADHWYRKADEGTRVCGNLGHWIDLTVHIWQWRSLPDWIDIQIAYATDSEADDNLCVTFTTNKNDLVSIMLTARTEPFEGIRESINLQYGTVIANIDDFRTLTIWQGSNRIRRRYRPKDVGHERAILQPYSQNNRDWNEVNVSTLLMLYIKDMVLKRQQLSRFDMSTEIGRLEADLRQEMNTPTTLHSL